MKDLEKALKPEREVIDNNLVILVDPRPRAELIAIAGSHFAGAVFEPQGKAGLARFTADMMMRGTESRSYSQIIDGAESLGARIDFNSGEDLASSTATCTPDTLDSTVELLMDCVINPVFPEEEIEKVRGQILTRILLREDRTAPVARRIAREMLYPEDNPYHNPLDGYEGTIKIVDRKDVAGFWDDHYGPESTILSFSGRISLEEAVEVVAKHSGGWQEKGERPAVPNIAVKEPESSKKTVLPMMHKSQVDIAVMCQTVARKHPDHQALKAANIILGRLGLMGRFGRRIRGEEGLAYYATSQYNPKVTGGYWMAYAGVNPSNAERALEAIYEEMRSMATKQVTEEEYGDSVTNTIGSLALRLETSRNSASFLNQIEIHDLGLDYVERYEELVRSVSREDILRVCDTYLRPEKSVSALVGPYDE